MVCLVRRQRVYLYPAPRAWLRDEISFDENVCTAREGPPERARQPCPMPHAARRPERRGDRTPQTRRPQLGVESFRERERAPRRDERPCGCIGATLCDVYYVTIAVSVYCTQYSCTW